MARNTEGGLSYPPNSRPSLTSQHSNSVPSTPHQRAREFASRSRSPSPNGGLGSHSPRSVSSEANGTLPALRKPRSRCKFETGMAFGRRRIPYNIGTDLLEKASEDPKSALDPEEEKKLTEDMQVLYSQILPSAESEQRRVTLVKKLESILYSEFSGHKFQVHVFGSSGNLLCTSDSDVDVCLKTSMKKLESMHILAEVLAKHGMEKVVCVPAAKVPIVKLWDPELQLACDVNVNNTLALENTRMIKTYVQIDDRVRPLAMIVKHWTKQRILNDAALGGTLSSYTWICMILNFLQTRSPPILPALHLTPQKKPVQGEQSHAAFADDLDALRGFGDKNKETLGQLLFHFFRRYGHEIDYEKSVISVRNGRVLTRKEKGWDSTNLSKEGRDRLCVEEPFNISRNLGNSADDTAWRGIHLELRQAFDFLANGVQLDKCCQQYEYPPEEKPVWRKPAPAPKPILSAGVPSNRGGRGGHSHRGGRGNYSQRNNMGNGRRASSGAYFPGNNRPPFIQSPPMGLSGQDYFRIYDQLYQQYQLIEMQTNSLKAQSLLLQQAQQAQLQAQVATHGQSRGNNMNGQSSPRMPDSTPTSAIATPTMPGFLYPYSPPYEQSQAMMQSMSQDGNARTNPSSPSLTSSAPSLRRSVHRPSVTNESPSSSIRSQSQPARSVPSGLLIQGIPGYPPPPVLDPATLANYQAQAQAHAHAQVHAQAHAHAQHALAQAQQAQQAQYAHVQAQAHAQAQAQVQAQIQAHAQAQAQVQAQVQAQMQSQNQDKAQGQTQSARQVPEPPQATPVPQTPVIDPSFNQSSRNEGTASAAPSSGQETPKEYVGYYVGDSPQSKPQFQNYKVAPIPSFKELAARKSRAQEPGQALLSFPQRHLSRSPSPLASHLRSYSSSTGTRSGGRLPPLPYRGDKTDSIAPQPDDGVVIVNGSYPVASSHSREFIAPLSASTDSHITDESDTNSPYQRVPSGEHYSVQSAYPRYLSQSTNQPPQRQNSLESSSPPKGPNGIIYQERPLHTDSLPIVSSTAAQTYPQLREMQIPYHYPSGYYSSGDSSPPSTHGHQVPNMPAVSGMNGVPSLDMSRVGHEMPQEVKSAGLPLLSPVFETHTPSPTATRLPELFRKSGPSVQVPLNHSPAKENKYSVNGIKGTKDVAIDTSSPITSKPDAHLGEHSQPSSATHVHAPQHTWQKSGRKKGNKKGKGGAQSGPVMESKGQPVPIDDAERKGG